MTALTAAERDEMAFKASPASAYVAISRRAETCMARGGGGGRQTRTSALAQVGVGRPPSVAVGCHYLLPPPDPTSRTLHLPGLPPFRTPYPCMTSCTTQVAGRARWHLYPN